ncbi:MAG TPA: Trm112 family protein [Gemmataceae bacterium]|nr:Trm112 family protein [Gemmataceae bacterium]
MLSPDFVDALRCPNDPSHTRVALEGEALVCQRCRLRFPIRDGFPNMIVEEAELPPGCTSLDQLPCRQQPKQP